MLVGGTVTGAATPAGRLHMASSGCDRVGVLYGDTDPFAVRKPILKRDDDDLVLWSLRRVVPVAVGRWSNGVGCQIMWFWLGSREARASALGPPTGWTFSARRSRGVGRAGSGPRHRVRGLPHEPGADSRLDQPPVSFTKPEPEPDNLAIRTARAAELVGRRGGMGDHEARLPPESTSTSTVRGTDRLSTMLGLIEQPQRRRSDGAAELRQNRWGGPPVCCDTGVARFELAVLSASLEEPYVMLSSIVDDGAPARPGTGENRDVAVTVDERTAV